MLFSQFDLQDENETHTQHTLEPTVTHADKLKLENQHERRKRLLALCYDFHERSEIQIVES